MQSVGGFGGGGFAATQPSSYYGDGPALRVGKDVWQPGEVGTPDPVATHELLVTKNRSGRKFVCDAVFHRPTLSFHDPKGSTVRPFELPTPEPVERGQYKAGMRELQATCDAM